MMTIATSNVQILGINEARLNIILRDYAVNIAITKMTKRILKGTKFIPWVTDTHYYSGKNENTDHKLVMSKIWL